MKLVKNMELMFIHYIPLAENHQNTIIRMVATANIQPLLGNMFNNLQKLMKRGYSDYELSI